MSHLTIFVQGRIQLWPTELRQMGERLRYHAICFVIMRLSPFMINPICVVTCFSFFAGISPAEEFPSFRECLGASGFLGRPVAPGFRDNFAVRLFAGASARGLPDGFVQERHLEAALASLQQFDVVLTLENIAAQLPQLGALGWYYWDMVKSRQGSARGSEPNELMSLPPAVREVLRAKTALDEKLYSRAQELAKAAQGSGAAGGGGNRGRELPGRVGRRSEAGEGGKLGTQVGSNGAVVPPCADLLRRPLSSSGTR